MELNKKECHPGRAPQNIQGHGHSLTFSVRGWIPPSSHRYLLHSDLRWPFLPLWQLESILHGVLFPPSPTTHKLPLVWKRCSLQSLICFSSFNIQTCSYFLISSVFNLWDVSTSFLCSTSVLNSKRTVSRGATNGLLINKLNSLLLSPHSACPLEMSESDDQFLLKVILGHWLWRQYYPDLPFFSLSQSLLIHLPPSTS